MKKIIYILLFALVSAASFVACSEEQATTPIEIKAPGGLPSDPM
ncbi:hypothetical protein [Chryseolinea lacunae]|nr:hypothetical protein [Chryseolinea lacunae]